MIHKYLKMDGKKMDYKNFGFKQNIHSFGVSYICNYLNRAGFTILEVNYAPNHPYQLLARINDKCISIVVRTACHPDSGTINYPTLESLVRESEELCVLPHFASLSLKPMETNDIEVDDITEGQEYRVIFNGISAVHNSELLAANI